MQCERFVFFSEAKKFQRKKQREGYRTKSEMFVSCAHPYCNIYYWMDTGIDYEIIYHDWEYKGAINYDGTSYYNPPVMIKVGEDLYILGTGTSDSHSVEQEDDVLYIVAENSGLNYISMSVIDTKEKTISSCFLDSGDLENEDNLCYEVMDMPIKKQIKILSEYLPY